MEWTSFPWQTSFVCKRFDTIGTLLDDQAKRNRLDHWPSDAKSAVLAMDESGMPLAGIVNDSVLVGDCPAALAAAARLASKPVPVTEAMTADQRRALVQAKFQLSADGKEYQKGIAGGAASFAESSDRVSLACTSDGKYSVYMDLEE